MVMKPIISEILQIALKAISGLEAVVTMGEGCDQFSCPKGNRLI